MFFLRDSVYSVVIKLRMRAVMEFQIHSEYIELCKLLKAANLVMSGGEAKEVVAQGLAIVDGQPETRKRCKIRPGQIVEFEGTSITVTPAA